MNQRRTTRSKLPCYTFVFLGLAVLVFTWGLQYKLSLYAGPHSAIRQMIQAKLLDNEEQAAVPDPASISGPPDFDRAALTFVPGALLVPLLAFSILLEASQQSQEIRASAQPWRGPSQASFTAFFFRPPPALF